MEPTSLMLIEIAYKSVKIADVLLSIRKKLFGAQESLLSIGGSVKRIEDLLRMQINQPLISGLAILQDAEAEIEVDFHNGKVLAEKALSAFNRAEGQLQDKENILLAKVGKAVAYKLLNMKGAFANASNDVDRLMDEIQQRILEEQRQAVKHERDESDRAEAQRILLDVLLNDTNFL